MIDNYNWSTLDDPYDIEEFLDVELFTDKVREKYYNFANKLRKFKL